MSQYASFGGGDKVPPRIPPISQDPTLIAYGDDKDDPSPARPIRIDGSILSVSGISGLSVGECEVAFYPDFITVSVGNRAHPLRIGYSDVAALQVGGRGDVVTTSGGGWSGGGIFNTKGGIEDAAESMLTGVVLSAVLNKLTTVKKHQIETIFHLAWDSGSITFLNAKQFPSNWARRLSTIFQRIERERKRISRPEPMVQGKPDSADKVCPYCAETIKGAAIKCRYCGSDLTQRL